MAGTALDLDPLFHPKSIAVVGASQSPAKIGATMLLSILGGQFKGKVYPINPRAKEILGIRAYGDLTQVPEDIDLAIICVAGAAVHKAVEECLQVGVKFGLLISSGFGEVSDEGKVLEKDLAAMATRGGMRLVGPNSAGIVSSDASLCALINALPPATGNVSMISQSGSLGSLTILMGSEQGIGFNKFVSSGNEADLRTEDFIEYLAHDSQTRVILSFMERAAGGRRFLEVAREATEKKPLVILKGGLTAAGARAASSHTGSLAGHPVVHDAICKQTGIIQANTDKDLIDLAKALALSFPPRGRRIGIVTAYGGTAVITSDACAKEGLQVPDLHEELKEELNALLPPFWSHNNPIDITAAGLHGGDLSVLWRNSVEVLLRDDNIDALICAIPAVKGLFEMAAPRIDPNILKCLQENLLVSLASPEIKMAEALIELKETYNKPIVGIIVGFRGQNEPEIIKLLEENGIPVYESPPQAAQALSKMALYREYQASLCNSLR